MDEINILKISEKFAESYAHLAHQFTLEEDDVAKRAIIDATSMLQQIPCAIIPWVDVSDEGIVIVQWRYDHIDVVLLFAGDGIASFQQRQADREFGASIDLGINSESAVWIAKAIKTTPTASIG